MAVIKTRCSDKREVEDLVFRRPGYGLEKRVVVIPNAQRSSGIDCPYQLSAAMVVIDHGARVLDK